jgi:hypothetical protein
MTDGWRRGCGRFAPRISMPIALMQADPEVMRHLSTLFTGQTANRIQVWLTMLAFTGSRPLRVPAPPARRMKRSSAGSSRRASKPSATGQGRGNRNSG